MKTNLKRLALIALILSGGSTAFGDQTDQSVGDLPGYGETAYFHEDATYAENAEKSPTFVGDSHVGDDYVGDLPLEMPSLKVQSASHALPTAPTAVSPAKINATLTPLQALKASKSSANCEPTCESAGGSEAAGSLMGRINRKMQQSDYWMSTEALLWFAPNRAMPSLITTSDPQTLPVLPEGGAGNVETAFGDQVNGEVSGGVRLDFGKQVSEDFSIGGRLWWMANNDDSYSASGNGSEMSIGRPFYNVSLLDNDALLVALEQPAGSNDPNFTGAIAAQSQISLWAAEAYGLITLAEVEGSSLDLIGGYSHFSIDDSLLIQSVSINEDTARIREITDSFDIENRFNGGQIGFKFAMNHGRWTASSLTKIHLGNMNQKVNIAGSWVDQVPPLAPTTRAGGLLAVGNQGEFQRDTFAFAPEVNFKLGYSIRDNVNLTLGYSFIYFDNVALVGDVIDTHVDDDWIALGIPGSRPAFDFDDSSLWVQGLDFGLTIEI